MIVNISDMLRATLKTCKEMGMMSIYLTDTVTDGCIACIQCPMEVVEIIPGELTAARRECKEYPWEIYKIHNEIKFYTVDRGLNAAKHGLIDKPEEDKCECISR